LLLLLLLLKLISFFLGEKTTRPNNKHTQTGMKHYNTLFFFLYIILLLEIQTLENDNCLRRPRGLYDRDAHAKLLTVPSGKHMDVFVSRSTRQLRFSYAYIDDQTNASATAHIIWQSNPLTQYIIQGEGNQLLCQIFAIPDDEDPFKFGDLGNATCRGVTEKWGKLTYQWDNVNLLGTKRLQTEYFDAFTLDLVYITTNNEYAYDMAVKSIEYAPQDKSLFIIPQELTCDYMTMTKRSASEQNIFNKFLRRNK